MSISKRRKKKIVRALAVILLILSLLFCLYCVMNYFEGRSNKNFEEEQIPTIDYNGKTYELNSNVKSLLIIGLDKYKNEIPEDSLRNDQQCDFVLLLAINDDKKTITPIQISRDTMVDTYVLGMAGDRVAKINQQLALSHTYGYGMQISCRNTCDSVATLFPNVDVNDYVSFTMQAVPILNDLVDGVEVKITDDFSKIDKSLIKGQTVTLLGDQALTYVRGRYKVGDQTNNNRMNRQRIYLDKIYKKYFQRYEEDDTIFTTAISKISNYYLTNINMYYMQDLVEKLADYELQDIISLEGKSVLGEKYMEFYPDQDFLTKTVVENFYTLKE